MSTLNVDVPQTLVIDPQMSSTLSALVVQVQTTTSQTLFCWAALMLAFAATLSLLRIANACERSAQVAEIDTRMRARIELDRASREG